VLLTRRTAIIAIIAALPHQTAFIACFLILLISVLFQALVKVRRDRPELTTIDRVSRPLGSLFKAAK
jgi:hypothetical protein